ncbi:MAG: nucleotidyltransferase family protein [Bacteroidales bacterium]|nr:nucleotidyltransferase family protein [Bacteroidales bacterium]
MNYTREQLHERHRLSHQQIDRWLGENSEGRFLDEKLKQLERVKMFLNVSRLLKENGVDFVSFKGPLLSYRIYGDTSVRYSHDVDLLIKMDDIDKVVKILFENGYHFTEHAFWPEKKAQQELLIRAVRHLSFINPRTNFVVEIHWVLMQELPLSRKRQREILANNLTEIEFGGQKHSVLKPELELLYLMIHGVSHRWERLKWLADIRHYPFKEVNAEKFNKLVKEFRAGRIVGQTDFMLKKFFNESLPFSRNGHFPAKLVDYSIQAVNSEIKVEKPFADLMIVFKNNYLMFPGLKYKSKIIWGAFFRHGDLQVINSSSKLVYYLYRPYSLIKRRILRAG